MGDNSRREAELAPATKRPGDRMDQERPVGDAKHPRCLENNVKVGVKEVKTTKPEEEDDLFRPAFKAYKSRKPPPSLDGVIDHRTETGKEQFSRAKVDCSKEDDIEFTNLRANPPSQWELLSSVSNPGFHIIKNVFTLADQIYWSHRCLAVYSKPPNRRNIDVELPKLQPNDRLVYENWYSSVKDGHVPGLIDRLRWATLGYHHNWDTKEYSEDNQSPFPEEINELSKCIAKAVGYSRYKAEAAIVNYYPISTTLSGHTDHSEKNLAAPLISISLGLSAIFLLGGETKTTPPSAYFLHSGDIAVMEQKSRLCYHAVPRILENTWSSAEDIARHQHDSAEISPLPESDVTFCCDYLSKHRINLNIRQVNYFEKL